jgi:GNAT superfamily N-acetyltransferase
MPPRKRVARSTQEKRPTIRIREVLDADDVAVRPAYRLLTRGFAREERVKLDEWIGTLREKSEGLMTDINWHLLVAEMEGEVVGLASGWYLGNVNIGVIGYLAMVPDVRSRGIGTRLRLRLRRHFERDALRIAGEPLEAIIGEVSIDNPWLRTLSQRPGVLVLDFKYFQPSLYEGDKPSQYALYYEALRRPRSRLAVPELRRILYTVWRRIYRISRPLDDSAFRAILRSFGKRRVVGPLILQPKPSR